MESALPPPSHVGDLEISETVSSGDNKSKIIVLTKMIVKSKLVLGDVLRLWLNVSVRQTLGVIVHTL